MLIMNKDDIKAVLVNDIATVIFTKKDGSNRIMKCTLDPSYLPKSNTSANTEIKKAKTSDDILAVWDLDAQSWRSFKISSIQSIDV